MSLKQANLIQSELLEYRLSEIEKVDLVEKKNSDDEKTYHVQLVFKSGEWVTLDFSPPHYAFKVVQQFLDIES